jgi:hypothetical protein
MYRKKQEGLLLTIKMKSTFIAFYQLQKMADERLAYTWKQHHWQ